MLEDIPKLLVTNSEKEDRFYSLEPLCDILRGAEDSRAFLRACVVLCLARRISRSGIVYALSIPQSSRQKQGAFVYVHGRGHVLL